jgi:hypothetical protein
LQLQIGQKGERKPPKCDIESTAKRPRKVWQKQKFIASQTKEKKRELTPSAFIAAQL